jgi:hypothetical protein
VAERSRRDCRCVSSVRFTVIRAWRLLWVEALVPDGRIEWRVGGCDIIVAMSVYLVRGWEKVPRIRFY